MDYLVYAFLDAFGFILVAGLLLGLPFLFFFVYGAYVAYKIGIRGQPTDFPEVLQASNETPSESEAREIREDQAA